MRPSPWLLLSLAVVLGCGGEPDKIKVIPVTGTVTLDGKPLEEATVTFLPQTAQGVAAAATTDKNGHYVLQTAGAHRPGAAPGQYTVTIMKIEVKPLRTQEESFAQAKSQGANAMPLPTTESKQLLPAKYRNPALSGFTATVSDSGKNSFDFDVKSK